MKNFISISLLIILLNLPPSKNFKRTKDLSALNVIRDVIRKFYIEEEISDFEIFSCCQSIKLKWKLDEILNEIKSENFAVELKISRDARNYEGFIGRSSILLFCTNFELNYFLQTKKVYSPFPKLIKLIIFSLEEIKLLPPDETNLNQYQKLIQYYLPIRRAYYISNKKNSLELFTVQRETEKLCNAWQKVLINSFNKKSQKWIKTLENYKKNRNFYGCLKVFMIEYETQIVLLGPPVLNPKVISYLLSKGYPYTSNTNDIIKILSERANFTFYIQILHFKFDPKKGEIYTAIDIDGKFFFHNEVFYTGSYEHYHGALHITSHVYQQRDMYLVVTPGENFTPYEKLLLPFDRQTWTFLMSTIAAAFLTIFIVDFLPKIVQNIFYGFGNSSPMLNVLGIFFGIAQTRIPFSNFGRIILVTFVLFCMVLRNGYQGIC